MSDLANLPDKPLGGHTNSRASLKVPQHGDCQVCLQTAHGMHFGVLSCRACAAFFRRTVVLKRTYACRRADGKCEISKDERYICRQCRYNKCLQLGMTVDNVQWNRDTLKTTEKQVKLKDKDIVEVNSTELPQLDDVIAPPVQEQVSQNIVRVSPRSFQDVATNTSVIQRSAPIMLNPMVRNAPPTDQVGKLTGKIAFTTAPEQPTRFSMEHVTEMIEHTFNTFDAEKCCPEISQQNPLMRMHTALERHRRNQKHDVKMLQNLDLLSIYPFWEEHLQKMSEWFMFSKEFVSLPNTEKMLLFKNSCVIWQRLERLHISFEIFGPRALDEKILVLSDDWAANMAQLVMDLSSISDYDSEYLKSIFHPILSRVFEEVLRPMVEMKLTKIELTYMLCQLAFHVEGRPLTESSQQAAITFRNRISDDLHDYYTNVVCQPNYANRLIRIMNTIHAMEGIQNEKAKVLELARIFDVIKIDIFGLG